MIGALVLQCEGTRFVLVTADVAAVDASLADEVAAAAGLERAELALSASHTHSGPAGVVSRLHPADADCLDRDLRSQFIATAAEAIETARAGMESVDLVVGVAVTHGIAANRNDPIGPFDPRLTVLASRRGDGSFQGLICHFACHPTILGARNRLVSADFPGALRQKLNFALDRDRPAPVVLFVNGAAGDVSTRFTRRAQDAGEVSRIGAALATAAVQALENASPHTGPIRYGRTTVRLSRRARRPIKSSVVAAGTGSDHEAAGHMSPAQLRVTETRAQGAALLESLSRIPDTAIPNELALEAWALGDVVLLGVPGELFASLGSRIGSASADPTLILGYTNGYVGYLTDIAAHELQTYEALASPFDPKMGERVADAATALVDRIKRQSRRAC
jgi:neutral ceramidase